MKHTTVLRQDSGLVRTTSLFDGSRSNGAHVEVAFRGTDGDLWLYNSGSGATDTGQAMAAGSSHAL